MKKNPIHQYHFTLFLTRQFLHYLTYGYKVEVDIANPCSDRPCDALVTEKTTSFNVSRAIMHAIGLAEYIRTYGDATFDSFLIDNVGVLNPRPEAKREKYYFFEKVVERLDKAIKRAIMLDKRQCLEDCNDEPYEADQDGILRMKKNLTFTAKDIMVEFNAETKKLSDVHIEVA